MDSNKYVDYWMGHWSLILGHAQKQVQKKAAGQLKKGWMHGTSNENAIALSEKISKAVPVAEKNSLCINRYRGYNVFSKIGACSNREKNYCKN